MLVVTNSVAVPVEDATFKKRKHNVFMHGIINFAGAICENLIVFERFVGLRGPLLYLLYRKGSRIARTERKAYCLLTF